MTISLKQTTEQSKLPRTEGHCIMIKGLIYEEDIAILNAYVPNNKYVRQKLIELKGKIDKTTMIVGNSDFSLSIIDRTIGRND